MNSFLQSRHCSGRSWKSILSSVAYRKADGPSTYFTPSATSRSSMVGCAPMTRAVTLILLVSLVGVAGCREEPTIVIKFEPNDLAGAVKPADLATAPKPPVADMAVAVVEKKKGGKPECKVA